MEGSTETTAPGFICIPLGYLHRLEVASINLPDLCTICGFFKKRKKHSAVQFDDPTGILHPLIFVALSNYSIGQRTVRNLTFHLKSHLYPCVSHTRPYLCVFIESQNCKVS